MESQQRSGQPSTPETTSSPMSRDTEETSRTNTPKHGNGDGHEGIVSDEEEEEEEEDDDDTYRLSESPCKIRKVSDKKRLDTAAFQDWVNKNHHEITCKSASDAEVLPQLSTAGVIEERGVKKIISRPREYQLELFERAKTKNLIVVLDTGSGKTLIAALLLRHTFDQELEDRARGEPKKVAFFIVDKVALCSQQHLVLSNNLEQPIAKWYGNIKGMVKRKEFWDSQLEDNMGVVTTAQVLLDCLNNGFINMCQINLLIFDEAHHAKKNHPYARIIKSHYMGQPNDRRPRVFGMTASPVDAQTREMKAAASELEGMLCSEIATVSDAVLAESLGARQLIESTEYYGILKDPEVSQTPLWDAIYEQVSENSLFHTALESAKEASSTLGPWCADRYWSLFITETEATKLIARTESDVQHETAAGTDQAVSAIHHVQEMVRTHHPGPASRDTELISTKVEKLWQVLDSEFGQGGAQRCIVFVEKRFTAVLLADLLQQPGMQIPGVIASYMVGMTSSAANINTMTYRDQLVALDDFRRGETTCLFATPAGEEGIDIPACDLVIRFDLYNSVIQYIQSRGRARQASSRFVNLVEEGNLRDLRRLKQATRDSNALQMFCSALPEDRKIRDQEIDFAAMAEAKRVGQKAHVIEKTGARLSFENSLEILARFTSSLASPGSGNVSPEYIVSPDGQGFKADVILPESSPVNFVTGFVQRSKQLARYSAAYEACMMLLESRYIDNYLQPIFAKNLPVMRNARLAVTSNKKTEYEMRIKPKLWSQLGSEEPLELFPTALALEVQEAAGRPSRPLILLTRQKLVSVPAIPLFFGNGHASLARLVVSDAPLSLSQEQLACLRGFTLKVFSDVFSKEYEVEAKDMPYFFAPSADSHDVAIATGSVRVHWDLIQEMQDKDELNWEDQPVDFFRDKLVTDPLDGSRKLITHGINTSLKPGDPAPSDAPLPKSRAYRSVEPTIKEYSNSLFLKARKNRQWRDDQPVVDAEVLSLRRNFLDQFDVDKTTNLRCCIILEPLKVSPIPLDVVNMAVLLPGLIHRVEASLIVQEACGILGLDIHPELSLEAFTKDSDNMEEHGEEQINFQAGMGNNYERLEFLGDTFLKTATTIALFTLMPKKNEFEYHVERMLLVANKNLFNHAVDRKLQEYIRSKAFDRRSWYPNLPLKRGKAPKTEMRHNLADKSVADVCEALIGAAYLSGPRENMDMAVRAVTKMVKSKNHKMMSWNDYYAAYEIPDWQASQRVTESQRSAVELVKRHVGYTFRSAALLRSACKHPSYTYEPTVPNYQRLEFLGDALLDMMIVDYLFSQFPTADPQWLTEHKMAMVSNEFLGCVCVKLQMHKHLLVTSQALIGARAEYVSCLERAEAAAKAEGDGTAKDFWRKTSQPPPKALADVVEALVGAMFVDSEYDFSVVQDFFNRLILPYFEDMAVYDTYANKHPVTALSKRLQAGFGCARWRLCTSVVPCSVEEGVKAITESDVMCALLVHGKVVEHATAKSGRYAKIACAKKAAKRFAEMGRETYRADMGCDCSGDVSMEDHGTAI